MRDTPEPDFSRIVTESDFKSWCDNPVTRFVAASMMLAAEACKSKHLEHLWLTGQFDEKKFSEARLRAEDYEGFNHTRYEDYVRFFDPKLFKERVEQRPEAETRKLRQVRRHGGGARSASERLQSGLASRVLQPDHRHRRDG